MFILKRQPGQEASLRYDNKQPAEGNLVHDISVISHHDPKRKLDKICNAIHFHGIKQNTHHLVTPLYLVEDLVDKIHIVSGGQQDGMHHVIDMAVLLLNATQTGIAVPSIGQRAAVGVALLRLTRWPGRIALGCLLLLLLLAATACSDSLGNHRNGETCCRAASAHLNNWALESH